MAISDGLFAGAGSAAAPEFESEHGLARRNLGERRKQDDLGARVLRPEDQHFGLKAGDVARRKVDDANNQPADKFFLRIAGDLGARPFPAQRAEVHFHLIRRISRPLERLDRDDAADADVDPGEVVVDDRRLVHQAFSASRCALTMSARLSKRKSYVGAGLSATVAPEPFRPWRR